MYAIIHMQLASNLHLLFTVSGLLWQWFIFISYGYVTRRYTFTFLSLRSTTISMRGEYNNRICYPYSRCVILKLIDVWNYHWYLTVGFVFHKTVLVNSGSKVG